MSKLFQNAVVVYLGWRLWGAREKLKPEDIGIDPNQIPPKQLASLGSKRIFDPKRLIVFNSLKSAAERTCLSVGTRFMGGYVIPLDKAEKVASELKTIVDEAQQALTQLGNDYEEYKQEWINDNVQFKDILNKSILPWEVVKSKYAFSISFSQVNSLESLSVEEFNLKESSEDITSQIYHEVSVEAAQLFKNSYQGKDKVTQKFLRPIRRVQKKLEALSFVDPDMSTIVDHIHQALEELPTSGFIEGHQFTQLGILLQTLKSPNALRQLAQTYQSSHSESVVGEQTEIVANPPKPGEHTNSPTIPVKPKTSGKTTGCFF